MCPEGKSRTMLVVSNFLAGSGASCGITLTGPIMADMFRKEDRASRWLLQLCSHTWGRRWDQ
jgi:hypothetical protein